jgi:hypothetical protein
MTLAILLIYLFIYLYYLYCNQYQQNCHFKLIQSDNSKKKVQNKYNLTIKCAIIVVNYLIESVCSQQSLT